MNKGELKAHTCFTQSFLGCIFVGLAVAAVFVGLAVAAVCVRLKFAIF